jgi:hypothetical protein
MGITTAGWTATGKYNILWKSDEKMIIYWEVECI